MKITKKISIILVLLLIISSILWITPIKVFANTLANSPKESLTLASEGAILIESSTGQILYGKNENKKLYPASTTKILTAIIAIENCNSTDKITASYNAVMSLPAGYSNAAIQPNETLTFQELLDMFLIHSANEVGTIFAEHVSGSVENFAVLMNQKATEIGCKNTHFTNPSGIHDSEHYSTPYDMALIARYCMKNETFRNTVSKKSCTIAPTDKYEERYFRNTNDLINPSSNYYYKYAIGTKTGYTSQAKRCLIATSLKDGFELIAVVLGAKSELTDTRYVDTINLFEYGYSNYKIEKIATKNSVIKEIVIENGTSDTKNLSLLLKEDIIGVIPLNTNSSNQTPSIHLNNLVAAPIVKGDVLGKITYNINGTEYASELIASSDVEEFDPIIVLKQILLAIFALFILSKLCFKKKKSKNLKSKKKKSVQKKPANQKRHNNYKKYSDSIYKF